jgi:UDP-N-acetylmuramoyl-L-alanyl-D-glutamate--2,6-diaminopimelate ligase
MRDGQEHWADYQMETSMKLTTALTGLEWRCTAGDPNLEITGVFSDSRRVTPGSLFICITGLNVDGRTFIPDALRRGARAIIDDRPLAPAAGETIIQVTDARKALAVCCANWYGNPSRQLTLIGITGTNGKTTTAFFVDAILRASGIRTGMITTVYNKVDGRTLTASHTTPGADELHRLFGLMVQAGATHCAMEVSSHALDQDRVYGLDFAAGVFTNLSYEHLEYHASLDEYLAVKSRLFAQSRISVLNRDDAASYQALRNKVAAPVLDYGFADGAQVQGHMGADGGDDALTIRFRGVSASVRVALPGRYNASNALAAAATALALGCDLATVAKGLAQVKGVPGRFEEVRLGQSFRVVVDYAHSPDGLTKLLTTLRGLTEGSLVLIFGARGGRDRAKRAMMGAIAARLCDYCYITADSPNDEPLEQILGDLERGFLKVKSHGYELVPDRRTAMRLAVAAARPRDTVVATGRGHESEFRVGPERYDLKDSEVFREAIEDAVFQGLRR